MGSCVSNKLDEVDEMPLEEKNEQFVLDVPVDFDWSNISGVGITVNIKKNGTLSHALNNTILELYDEDDMLLDALVVIDGKVEFNVRVPSSSTVLKIVSAASGTTVEIDRSVSSLDFNIPNISAMAFARIDSDGDSVFDEFDAEPLNPNVAVSITNFAMQSGLKSASAKSSSSSSYVIFEDLWPAKGDYDFNDLVCKTTFSWERGKSNYIEEISGVCEVEWIGAGMQLGLGFELFEMKGTNLYYIGDAIGTINNANVDNSVTNGFIVFDNVKDVGTNEVSFSFEIENEIFKDFLCVPYLFRTADPTHQVRPYGAPPTQKQDMSLFRSHDDASPRTWSWDEGTKFKYPLEEGDAFYRSAENHPWGIEFITKNKFKPCTENRSILKSYPEFRDWAESGGKNEKEWYDHPE